VGIIDSEDGREFSRPLRACGRGPFDVKWYSYCQAKSAWGHFSESRILRLRSVSIRGLNRRLCRRVPVLKIRTAVFCRRATCRAPGLRSQQRVTEMQRLMASMDRRAGSLLAVSAKNASPVCRSPLLEASILEAPSNHSSPSSMRTEGRAWPCLGKDLRENGPCREHSTCGVRA
jgi:hypothetical protein